MKRLFVTVAVAALLMAAMPAKADIVVPINRSSLITLSSPMAEVMVANPDIADVHAHNATSLTVVAKRIGQTNVRIFDKSGKLLRTIDITVSYDLPAIRKALKNFLPDEMIGIEMVNTSVALTGQISNATVADKAVKIVRDFLQDINGKASSTPAISGGGAQASLQADPQILNMMQVISGQQVMLKVRVGEIQRSAVKDLGVDLNGSISKSFDFASGIAGLAGLIQPVTQTTSNFTYGPGHLLFPADSNNVPTNTNGIAIGTLRRGNSSITGALQALEQDGLFRLLAEPNLIAISGEQAEFLAGGEIPIPVPQGGGGLGANTVTIDYKPYGVAVRFKPFVLTENRIRMEVQPEVSEIDTGNSVTISGYVVPALTTRRANTTVELAPGESFMIAGLLQDQSQATINQIPGLKELPILGALFRSTAFTRNETELVIAVTPYVVDPLKSSDVKLPTDNFRPSSQMELFFYGALGSLSGNAATISQTPSVEGPIGFMVD